MIPKKRFERLVRHITHEDLDTTPKFFQASTLMALQEACEAYLVNFFEDAMLAGIHSQRVTLAPKDLSFVQHIRYRQNRL